MEHTIEEHEISKTVDSFPFHRMLEKLYSGEWKYATTQDWQDNDGEYVTMKRLDGRVVLLFHEGPGRAIGWTLNMASSLSIDGFIELKL